VANWIIRRWWLVCGVRIWFDRAMNDGKQRLRMTTLTRRWILGGLLAGAADCALASPPTVSPRPVRRPDPSDPEATTEALIAKAGLGGKLGFVVADAATGEVLGARNPALGLPPASTAKVITTAYALDRLGPEYRFVTRLLADGAIENGILQGDLILVGGGDPTLDTNGLADLAKQLKAVGLRGIKGRFLTYGAGLPHVDAIDPEQPAHVSYSPAVSGLNLNFNRVYFEWTRAGAGYGVTLDARSDRYRPEVTAAHIVIEDRGAPVYTYDRIDGRDQWSVARKALGKGGSRWLPVRDPQGYCADVFATFARAHGIVLPLAQASSAPPQGTMLAQLESEPLHQMLRGMLKHSTNLTAECVGMTATALASGRPSGLKASGSEMQSWLDDQIGALDARFVDHSGLGDGSRISAQEMVRALVQLGSKPQLAPMMKQMWMRDAKGRPDKSHAAIVRAKTGTLNFVSALAGYVTVPDGRDLAFTILTAEPERRAAIRPQDRERPRGGRAWAGRSRMLQMRLIEHWVNTYRA
jgi:D-alanyl-D-alanine carboxypeptidase/D-alanyl-D-alanine-endopeptidase (penicillin-binding protein 4)